MQILGGINDKYNNWHSNVLAGLWRGICNAHDGYEWEKMITRYQNVCLLCDRPADETHHLIYGRGLRKLSDEDQITVPLCAYCHRHLHQNGGVLSKFSKIAGQLAWEKEYMAGKSDDGKELAEEARERFRDRYGRSWI